VESRTGSEDTSGVIVGTTVGSVGIGSSEGLVTTVGSELSIGGVSVVTFSSIGFVISSGIYFI
jgi:hypothetical protein